ncbi:unnamed protein product [Sympodiomycopsis kandeliae]
MVNVASTATSGPGSPVGIAQTVQSSLAILWICTGITAAEQVALAKFDWSLITGQRRRRLVQLAYFGAKLTWWAYTALNIVMNYGKGPFPSCQGLIIGIETCMSFIAIFSSILLAARTVCVYQGNARKWVTAAVTIGAMGLAAAWLAGVNDIKMEWSTPGAYPWQDGACGPTMVHKRYFVKYLITILYDLFVLILTTVGVVRMSASGSSRIGAILVEQGILYFLVTFLANLLVLIFTLAPGLPPVWNLFWAIPSSAVALTASTRLYVSLAEAASHNTQHVTDSQLTSGSSKSGKFIDFLTRSKRKGGIPGVHSGTTSSNGAQVSSQQGSVASYGVTPAVASQSDIEKQGSSDGLSANYTDLTPTRSGHPFAAVGRSNGGIPGGVQVSQTRTETEEPIPEYLVHPGFLTDEQLARVEPNSQEARRVQDPVRAAYPGLRGSLDPKSSTSSS